VPIKTNKFTLQLHSDSEAQVLNEAQSLLCGSSDCDFYSMNTAQTPDICFGSINAISLMSYRSSDLENGKHLDKQD
jgi:hypothetical protein